MPIQPILPLGGVNLLQDPKRIADNELVESINMAPVVPGVLSKRKGLSLAHQSVLDTYYPKALLFPVNEVGVSEIVVANPFNPSGPSADGYPTAIYGADVGGSYLFSNDFGVRVLGVSSITLGGRLYLFGGYPCTVPGKMIAKDPMTPGGLTCTNFTWDDPSNTFSPGVAAVYRSRAVYGNLGPGYENYIVFSDRFLPATLGVDVLLANGRSVQVGDSDGDRIIALVDVMLTAVGSPAQSALLVLKEQSAYLVTGEPNETTDSTDPFGDLTINRYNFTCGCSSANSVVRTPYGLLWASLDDVWMYDGGQLPRRVGSKIRKALGYSPAAQRYRWHAAYFNGFYRLAVFGQGQVQNDNVPLTDQWWLDLREGPPQSHVDARWWGPQRYKILSDYTTVNAGTTTFAVDSRPGKQPALYGCEQIIIGSGPKLGIVAYDTDDGRDRVEDATMSASAFSGTEIVGSLTTKMFDMGDPIVEKLFQQMEASVETMGIVRMYNDVALNGSASSATQTAVVLPSGIVMDESTLDGPGILDQQDQPVKFDPESLTRLNGRHHQYTLRAAATNEVIAGYNDVFFFSFDQSVVTGDYLFKVTITVGPYTSLTLLVAEIVRAMNASYPAFYGFFSSAGQTSGSPYINIAHSSIGWGQMLDETIYTFPVGTTDAQKASTRRVWERLGFTTTADPSGNTGAGQLDQTSDTSVYSLLCYDIRISQLNVQYEVQPRR